MREKNMKKATKKESREENASKELPAGCLRFFGLPFFLIGLALFIWGSDMFYQWLKSGSWAKTKATVLSARMKSSTNTKGRTAYSVSGRYGYEFAGNSYENDRIEIDQEFSSDRKGKEALLEILETAMADNRQIDILVNPDNPNESLVFRNISTGMIIITGIGAIFSIAGAMLVSGLIPGIRNGIDREKLKKTPDSPWLADSRWQGFTIRTVNCRNLLISWAIAVLITVFVTFFLTVMLMDNNVPVFAWAIIGIFTLAALFIDASTIYQTIRYFRFGESSITISQFPIAIGDEFVAVMSARRKFAPGQDFFCELLCEKKTTTGTGKNSHSTTEILYKSCQQIRAGNENFTGHHFFLPVKLKIVNKAPQTTSENANPSVTWKLNVSAAIPGVDFAAEFILPDYLVNDRNLIKHKVSQ
jgi:hypothetical protein